MGINSIKARIDKFDSPHVVLSRMYSSWNLRGCILRAPKNLPIELVGDWSDAMGAVPRQPPSANLSSCTKKLILLVRNIVKLSLCTPEGNSALLGA